MMAGSGITRREALAGIAAGAAAGMFGSLSSARAAVSEMVWATWDSNGHPEYIAAFEAQTGVKVKLSYLSSEDAQFAALKTGTASDWDMINPSLNGSWRYIKAGLLEEIDVAKIANAAKMYDVFKTTPKVLDASGKQFAVPYLWGLNPIVYRKDKFDSEPDYTTLFNEKYKGQLAMRDYALESIAIAGLVAGVPRDKVFVMETKELAEAKKLLVAQKPLLRTYWQTIGDLTNLFATGEVSCAFSWRVPYDALKDKLAMGMAKPKAGIMGWCDCFAMPATLSAEKSEIGYKFIDYLLGAEFATQIAKIGNYATTSSIIRDELSKEQQEAIFIDDMDVMKSFMWPVAPENYSEWLKIWNEVKAS
ncbi:PotD/PotF family extracellular solute-binding protein [Rhizobium rhizogenes]|jgi:spermidine/putrescine transport system substrate-binding protein|uniref:ABC transporter substrate-binding protein n=1 Tax=Rhizobium rhizogenes TaxID=359 RepID=UPI001F1D7D2B|nr:extracellular solute-binding protein [Rhizobium rhizogenes]